MPCSAITPRILIHISSQANNACATWNYRELNELIAREDLGLYKCCACKYSDRDDSVLLGPKNVFVLSCSTPNVDLSRKTNKQLFSGILLQWNKHIHLLDTFFFNKIVLLELQF